MTAKKLVVAGVAMKQGGPDYWTGMRGTLAIIIDRADEFSVWEARAFTKGNSRDHFAMGSGMFLGAAARDLTRRLRALAAALKGIK